MAIELRQQLKLTQQLVMTPQLQMAIKLLQLSRLELMETISRELEENPALEEVRETTDDLNAADREDAAVPEEAEFREVEVSNGIHEEIDWSNIVDEPYAAGRVTYEAEDRDAPRYEAFISRKESLTDHLLWQLGMSVDDDRRREIGGRIIGNLDKNGYLQAEVSEIARAAGVNDEDVVEMLTQIQHFDPVGVAARSLSECLKIQAAHLDLLDPLVERIIGDHLNHLETKNYKAVCRALKVDLDSVMAAVNVIRQLDPMPGIRFETEEPQYINPDVFVYPFEDDFVIVLNDDGMPKLRVNRYYQNAIAGNGALPDETKSYVQERLKSAAWLIKSIHQRQKTIYRVMESIVRFQRPFFEKGISGLKPMILRDVAQDIEMHESTISRVTTNKYAYTPQGIFELKFFFNSSINRVHGEAIASASVQERIRRIIENEDPKKPLSDKKIAAVLQDADIDIARRTVAKYREMMRILPSGKRRRL